MALPPQALRDDERVRPAAQLVAWALWHFVADKDPEPANWLEVDNPNKPNDLVRLTGLCRSTVYRGLAKLEECGWWEPKRRRNPHSGEWQEVRALRRSITGSETTEETAKETTEEIAKGPPSLRVIPSDFDVTIDESGALQSMLDALMAARADAGFPVVKYSLCKSNCEDALALLRAGIATPDLLVDAVRACVWRDSQSSERDAFARGEYATPSRPFRERNWHNTLTYVATWKLNVRSTSKVSEKGKLL